MRLHRIAVFCIATSIVLTACHATQTKKQAPAEPTLTGDMPFLGNSNASVTMIEYFDFQCMHCKHTSQVLDELLKAYPRDLKIVSRPYMRAYTQTREAMLAHASFRAAAAALAAHRQGHYVEMMHALFNNQSKFSENDLVRYAQTIGLNVERFNRDRTDSAILAEVERNATDAGRAGVENTPGIVIGGKTYQGGRDFDFYSNLVAQALGRSPVKSENPTRSAAPVTWNDMIFPVAQFAPITSKPVLKIGDQAPDFTLPGACGKTFTLSDYRGKKNVIVSFVPAAFTPVCSGQWPHYIAHKDEFDAFDTIVLGITEDNIPSLYAWTRGMEGLNFPVLSDFWPHGATAKKYGVLRPESGTSERALFLIDKKGVLRYMDIHDINTEPDIEPLMQSLKSIANPN